VTQRSWFITGVNSGFGRQMTEQLLARGDRVAGTVRKMDAMNDLKATYGDLLWLARLDVTDTPAIREVVNKAFADLGKIDVVVNNAGYGLFGAAEELTDDQILHQLNTNLIGSIQVVRAALPHLRAQGGGRIIQLSTYGGQAAFAGGSLYHASKWGIEGFIEATMQEVAPFHIGVTIVEPGGARTAFRFGGARLGPKMDVYDDTPAGMTRRVLRFLVNAEKRPRASGKNKKEPKPEQGFKIGKYDRRGRSSRFAGSCLDEREQVLVHLILVGCGQPRGVPPCRP
jgi:NAD(P)-dependent dehydrogenase (short-subunit alcohol dehydrogenase family)